MVEIWHFLYFFLPFITHSTVFRDPRFASRLSNVTIVSGREAKLGCVVENLQHFKVAWVHYGSKGSAVLTVGTQVLTTNARVSVMVERDTWFLTIVNASKEDVGEYMCQISTVPPKKMYATLQVQEPPSITNPPSDISIKEGQNVTLKCDATGDPSPQITWRKEYTYDVAFTGNKEWRGRTLSLYNVTRKDAAAFLCVASNGVPPAVSARAQVNVVYSPVIETFEGLSQSVVRGSKAVFNCSFRAYPPPNVQWSRNGTQSYNQEFEVETDIDPSGQGLSLLLFKEVKKVNFGGYKCTVENEHGVDEKMFYLHENLLATILPRTTTRIPVMETSSLVSTSTKHPPVRIGIVTFSKNISIDRIIRRYLGDKYLFTSTEMYNTPRNYETTTHRSRIHSEMGNEVYISEENDILTSKIENTKEPKRFRQDSSSSTNKLRPFSTDYTTGQSGSQENSSPYWFSFLLISLLYALAVADHGIYSLF